jgi:uncharacterized protein YggE
MNVSQAIKSPLGISVFGSALIRLAPDVASLRFSATRLQKTPAAAFKETRVAAQLVRRFLGDSGITDVQASRITLSQQWNYAGGVRRSEGYTARASFNVLLGDLERLEAILSGVVEAGANEVDEVAFQSRQLKEYRARARQLAALAARDKAEIYAAALGKGVGEVLHIEDVNPDQLRGQEGHVVREPQLDEDGPARAFDPGSIAVGAAVVVVFALTDPRATLD